MREESGIKSNNEDLKKAHFRIALFLGRHQTQHSGFWVHARALCAELLRQSSNLPIAWDLYVGGDPVFRDDLKREIEVCAPHAKSWCIRDLPQLAGRRGGMISDLFVSPNPSPTLLHGLVNTIPLRGKYRSIITLHDLLQSRPSSPLGSLYGQLKVVWYRILTRLFIRRASRVLSVSPWVAREIEARFHPHLPVCAIYSGLDRMYTDAALPDRELQNNYILAFAGADPRKNFEGILCGYKALSADEKIPLKIVISPPSAKDEMNEVVARYDLKGGVEFLSDVSRDDLVALYANARGVFFPSHGEGFGYPIYEALSQGVPVVCSEDFVIEEARPYLGQAIFPCKTKRAESIVQALHDLLSSKMSISLRQEVATTIRRATSIRSTAEALFKVYQEELKVEFRATVV